MKHEAKEIAERTVIGAAAVLGSWKMQHWSELASLVLTVVMIGWVLTQWVKFVVTWREERKKKQLEGEKK